MVNRKFWQWWVIANTLSLTGSLFLYSAFYWKLEAVRPPLEYDLRSSITSVSFALVGVSIGLAQWLVLKRKVSRISGLWILTNIPGLYVGMFISYVSFVLTLAIVEGSRIFEMVFELVSETAVSGAVGGAVGGATAGLITGIFQGLLLARRVGRTRLWLLWTIINTIAWALSWSVGWAFGLVVAFEANNTVSPAFQDDVLIVVFLIIFGMIFSFLNAMITGRVLIKVLRNITAV